MTHQSQNYNVMDVRLLKAELRKDEGLRLKRYKDSKGTWTIGYGHNLSAHKQLHILECTLEQAEAWLEKDVMEAIEVAKKYCRCFNLLSNARQRAIVNMAFCLEHRLADFSPTFMHIERAEFADAAKHIRSTLFARQTFGRAERIAVLLEEG